MTDAAPYDLAVIGGGVMGCLVALHLARVGMRAVVLEARGGLCTQASGVNTGHVAVMDGRPYRVPYALRSMELWASAGQWLGTDVGFRSLPGLKVAFTEAEAEELAASVEAMRAEGATLEMVGANRAREIEPGLSPSVRAAAWSPRDGYANPLRIADGFAAALAEAGVAVRLHAPVQAIDPGPPFAIQTASGPVRARRLLLAAGVWIGEIAALLGVALPMSCRVSQVSVTERQPPLIGTALGTATDTLSLKQVENGTVLIGGGWQGIGSPADGPREVIPEHVIGNLRLACATVPALAQARVVRTWLGLEARAADNLPLAGPLPGVRDGWVLGAVHTGFALSPAIAEWMAGLMLGRAAAVPAFDPARFARHGVAADA